MSAPTADASVTAIAKEPDPEYPKGSDPAWRECAVPYACTLTLRACCEGCGVSEASAFFAVANANEPKLREKVCPEPMSCPECASLANPNVFAGCRASRCEVIDLRKDEASACTKDDDCIARVSGCCEPCDGGTPQIALRKDAIVSYKHDICGKTKCGNCPAKTWPAKCDAKTKHCVLSP